jgi:O-antigen/teichoic acid export membrane protein
VFCGVAWVNSSGSFSEIGRHHAWLSDDLGVDIRLGSNVSDPAKAKGDVRMATLTVPIRRARGYLRLAQSDSLVRNSVYLMATTVVTGGLGYVFWVVAAHLFTSAQVGAGSAVISFCTMVALFTYLGAQAMLIERLPGYEGSRKWTADLVRVCVATSAMTAIVAAIAIPVIAQSKSYRSFFSAAGALLIAIIGSAIWTLVNLFGSAFISARRADGMLTVQGLISLTKVFLLVAASAIGLGDAGIVASWVGSAFIGILLAVLWFLPRLGLGRGHSASSGHRAPGGSSDRKASADGYPRHIYRGTRRRRSSQSSYARRLVGQHLTSVGGALTPLILPILVVLRLGASQNAYFYITWMVGSLFFMVSPSISSALFAESVRINVGLRDAVIKAFQVTSFILIPAILIMIAGGRIILGIFGKPYVDAGYGLLVVLAISAIPDAVSNIAVSVFRVTNRLAYSATLNIGIMLITTICAWWLTPSFGIAGAGIAWLVAQVVGAIASIPAYMNLNGKARA